MNIFKRKLGSGHPKPTRKTQEKNTTPHSKPPETSEANTTNGVPEIVARYREAYKGKSLEKLNEMYFKIMDQLTVAEKKGDISTMLMHCQGSLGLIESLIKYNKKEYGRFDILSIPALDKALIYYAINGSTGQLKNIQDIVNFFEELHPYKDKVSTAFIRRDLAAKIYQYVKENPNCSQTELKKNIDFDDPRLISVTIQYMEKARILSRKKESSKTLLLIE